MAGELANKNTRNVNSYIMNSEHGAIKERYEQIKAFYGYNEGEGGTISPID